MGLFKKVASAATGALGGGALAGGGLGSALGGLVGGAGPGAARNFLLGRKSPEFAPYKFDYDPMAYESMRVGREAQRGALGDIEKLRKEGADSVAKGQMERAVKASTQAGKDQAMRLSDRLTRMGLGQSASGLAALSNVQRQTAENVAQNRASLKERIANIKKQRAMDALNASNAVVSSAQGYRTMIQGGGGGRQGGLLGAIAPIAGGIVGYKAGGMKGAGAGMQIGSGAGQSISNIGF